jgi:cyclohexa-1,5-dienecarbonyl-CoA hydratase
VATYEFIRVATADGVAAITLNRPPLNVLHIPMMAEINAALEAALGDRDVAAVAFRTTGKAFSAGVDVADHTAERVGEMIRQFHGIFRRLLAGDALTIAAVPGAALGGGCELACFCDIVLGSQRASFGQPEVQVGVFPPVAACVLPLRVGLGHATELTVLGATIDASEALRIGLINHVLPAETFDVAVDDYLRRIGRLSRPVLRLAKRATWWAARQQLHEHLEHAEQLYLRELMALADAHEGVAAFQAKRAPVWKHA